MSLSLSGRACPERGLDDNIRSGTVDDCIQFRLLGGGDIEFIQGLLKIVEKCLPFLTSNVQVAVRVRHRFPRVTLRATGGPADHLSSQVLESRGRNAMVGLGRK